MARGRKANVRRSMAKLEKKGKRNEDRSLTRTRKNKASLGKGERSKQPDLAVPAASSKRVKSDISAEPEVGCPMDLEDIALIVMSFLDVYDVLSIARCSRFWYKLSCSDNLWKLLYRRRWPNRPVTFQVFPPSGVQQWYQKVARRVSHSELGSNIMTQRRACSWYHKFLTAPAKGWRKLYMNKHEQVRSLMSSIMQSLPTGLPLSVIQYLEILDTMVLHRVGFEDVKCFFFNSSLNVHVNLIGLHYCILRLHLPQEEVMGTLRRMGVSRRTIKVQWVRQGIELLTLDLFSDPKCCIMLYLEDTLWEMVEYDNLLAMLELGASVKRRTITISPA